MSLLRLLGAEAYFLICRKENGDTAIRTTFHCEAFKLGMLATCKLEAFRLEQLKKSEFEKLTEEEKNNHRRRLDAVIDIIDNGI